MVFDEKKYQFRSGHSFPVAAQVAGEELEKLGINERPVKPSEVVNAARPKAAPLHPVFEWNNKKAADLFREDQARLLIRSVVAVTVDADNESDEDDAEPRIAFVSVGTKGPNGTPGYIAMSVAMEDDDMRGRVISDAIAQLNGWRRRFSHLQELASIVAVIDDALQLT